MATQAPPRIPTASQAPPPVPRAGRRPPRIVVSEEDSEERPFLMRAASLMTASFCVSMLLHLAVLSLLAFWMLRSEVRLELLVDSAVVGDDPIADVNLAEVKVARADAEVKRDDRPQIINAAVHVQAGGRARLDLDVSVPDFDGPGAGGTGSGEALFGTGREAKSFVYVVDCSSSMQNEERFARAVRQLVRSIDNLRSHQRFYVVFYSNATIPLFATPGFVNRADPPERARKRNKRRPARRAGRFGGALVVGAGGRRRGGFAKRLLPASARFKHEAQRWILTIRAGGGTMPRDALQLALSLKPEMIYFLTDGEIPEDTPQVVREANKSKVRVNTIALGEEGGGDLLKQIARENNGKYVFHK